MRRHAKATSSGSNKRKPSGHRGSPSSRLRLIILLATVAAFLLVPAAQAFAAEELHVNMAGSGAGEVSSVGGAGGEFEGEPPIACSYASPGPATGVCEDAIVNKGGAEEEGLQSGFGVRLVALHETPALGSEFVGWTVEEGNVYGPFRGCETGSECFMYVVVGEEENAKVKATFECEVPGTCGEATGPTNLRTLTITKNANGPGGTGSVSSKPKGIKCGATCSSAVARMYKSTPVELTAKPATGSAFVKWSNPGGACNESTNPICTVPVAEDESLEAVFSGASKTITPTEALTVSKGESTGKGTVKAAGLGCEADCSSTTVLYQGPITGEKPKPGKTVILKQAPAFGSTFAGWTGCDSETEAGECVVEMDEAHTVEAEYDALPGKVLTVNKTYSSGNGAVSSKPKGIACGTTCTQSVASMPEGAAVELIAKPTTGTFVKWEGGDCNGSTNPVCVVTMNADETTKAVFSDPGKAILNAQTLTLNKAGSGFGTVKASGIKCEVLCSSQSALYQGPITGEKPKPGKLVVLKATSAPGSKAVAWSGCDSEPSPSECVVEMDEGHSVTATFDELE